MNKQKWIAVCIVLTMIASAASALVTLKSRERTGQPGVKVGQGELMLPDGKVVQTNSVILPESLPGYTSRLAEVSSIELESLPRDTTFGRRIYTSDDGLEAFMSVVLMESDRSSIHTPHYCLAGQGWQIDKEERTTVRINQPHAYDLPIRKTLLSRQIEHNGQTYKVRGIFIYWFVADKKLFNGQRLWNMSWDVIKSGIMDRWAYVVCFSTCLPGQEDELYSKMERLIATSVPEFQLTTGPKVMSSASAE